MLLLVSDVHVLFILRARSASYSFLRLTRSALLRQSVSLVVRSDMQYGCTSTYSYLFTVYASNSNNTAKYWPDIPVAVAILNATVVMGIVCLDVRKKVQAFKQEQGEEGGDGPTLFTKVFWQSECWDAPHHNIILNLIVNDSFFLDNSTLRFLVLDVSERQAYSYQIIVFYYCNFTILSSGHST